MTHPDLQGTRSAAALLALVLVLPASASDERTPARGADERLRPDTSHAATEDAIRTVIAESAKAYGSNDCERGADAPWLPDQEPYVHFAAQDRVITLATRDEMVAYCQKLTQNRASVLEDVVQQTVHFVTPDVAYVVTRSNQSTQWRDGRTEVKPVVETAIVAEQGGRWRVIYKHLSWREESASPRF